MLKSALVASALCASVVFVGAGLGSARAEGTVASSGLSRLPDEKNLSDLQLLGKRLFEDASLSEPQGMSCATCHDPRHAFQGNNGSPIAAVALGSQHGQFGVRKVPTLMYKAYSPAFGFYKDEDDGKIKLEPRGGQFWDGRANLLPDQVTGPLLNPVEMNNPSIEKVVEKIEAGPNAALARKVYGDDVFSSKSEAMTKMAKAVAAFESSERFAPFSSKFDDYLRGKAELTALEKKGLEIFLDEQKSNCSDCHAAPNNKASRDPTDWIFSDFSYSAPGAPRNPAIPVNLDPEHFDLGLCQRAGLAAMVPQGKTAESYCGYFKAPTLRNVALVGPYFHNGVFKTLREAVAFYATRDTDPGRWYPKGHDGKVDKFNDLPPQFRENVETEKVPYDRKAGQKPHLGEKDIDAIVAFLNTLTDKQMLEVDAAKHAAE